MDKKQQCPKGQRWCPIKKRCIPDDDGKGKGQRQARGQGQGPMGVPRPMKEADDLVDVILNGDYDSYKKLEEADDIIDNVLDEVENRIDNAPDQDIEGLVQTVSDELSKDEEKPLEEIVAISISKLIREEDYREFFKGMLKKHNISNPSELNTEKKKEFFNAVDREWKAKKETD